MVLPNIDDAVAIATSAGEPSYFTPAAAQPGWLQWHLKDDVPPSYDHTFLPIYGRKSADGGAIVRFIPRPESANPGGAMHGGALLGFLDIALYVGARVQGGLKDTGAVTVDIQVQFVAASSVDKPVDAHVEIVRETRNMVFLRGVVVQGEGDEQQTTAAFSGILKRIYRK